MYKKYNIINIQHVWRGKTQRWNNVKKKMLDNVKRQLAKNKFNKKYYDKRRTWDIYKFIIIFLWFSKLKYLIKYNNTFWDEIIVYNMKEIILKVRKNINKSKKNDKIRKAWDIFFLYFFFIFCNINIC